MNRTVVVVGAAILLSLSCTGEKPRPAEASVVDDSVPRDGGTILRRLESDVTTLNPVMAGSTYDRRVANFLFAPLLNLDASLRPIAGVADTWEVSPDGKSYTFHLNPKATFSDRSPVRASDVLFTLKKIADPATEAAQLAGSFEQIDLPNCVVKDDHTLVLAFKGALASQLIQFNNLPILPERVYNRPDFKTAFTDTAVGSGPYRLVRRIPGKEILMERREDYWSTKPHIKSVLWKVVVDSQTALSAVKRGDLDETMITSDMWARESVRPELQRTLDFRRSYTLNYNFVGWNTRDPLFTDKRVRHALAMCVDLRAIINNLYRGTARAMSGPFTPDQWAYNPAVPVIEFDPPGARRLLASMGWLDSDGDGILDHDKKPFAFDMVVTAGTPVTLEFAQLYQAGLKEAGVKMNIVVIDPSVFFQRVFSGNYQAVYMSWELDPDPDPFSLFHSSQIPPHGQNLVYYSNPEADRLLEEGRRTLDVSKRIPIYQRLHQLLADDQPYTTTVQVSVKYAVRKRVRNVRDSKGWGILLWYPGEFDWWLAEDGRQRQVREQ
ncbi:MAG: ABC transporter substrate-binding protein [Acidobacteriota bacterium]